VSAAVAPPARRRPRRLLAAIATIGAFTLLGRRLGYGFGLRTRAQCRDGHLFTTIWIPGINLKGIDLGVARIQRCPVGRHWTLIRPVRESDLSRRERRRAASYRDIPIP
jgi:hypothetical protein